MSPRVPFIRPVMPDPHLIGEDMGAIVASNWYTNFGPFEREFSTRLGDYVAGNAAPPGSERGDGVHVVTVANATLGLLAAIIATVGRGDGTRSILVPSFTFAAGPQVIEWCGYRPVFIDIDHWTHQPSVESARTALEVHDVAALLYCNTFGIGNERIADWEVFAADAGVPLVIDSAAGFGSEYADGRRLGLAGACEVFSFHATKPFAIGEGGAVVTRDPAVADAVRSFENFGFDRTRSSTMPGLNAKLQEINAAIGLRQLALFDGTLEARRAVASAYASALEPLGMRFTPGLERSSVCFGAMIAPDRESRDRVLDRLVASGVEARAYYQPVAHLHPAFAAAHRADELESTAHAADTVVSLPVHSHMADDDVAFVVETITRALDGSNVDVVEAS